MGESFEQTIFYGCTGILLCGGKSRRMGFDKTFLQVDGDYLLKRHAARLQKLFGRVLAVCDKREKFAPHTAFNTLPLAEDHYPETGPLGGVCTAFEETDTPWLFVMACDMPDPDYNLLYKMADKRPNADVVVCQNGERLEPLFGFYHRRCLPVFAGRVRAGELRFRDAFSRLNVQKILLPEADERAFLNLNRPEDLRDRRRQKDGEFLKKHGLLDAPQMVMVGAFGRGDGKTMLACGVIKSLKDRQPVVGLKVICVDEPDKPCHRGQEGCGLCGGLRGLYDLREEDGSQPGKDTALMLAAGARRAFLLRSRPESLAEAYRHFMENIPAGTLVVCESNRLRWAVKPGVFLFAAGEGPPAEGKPYARELAKLADGVVPRGAAAPCLKVVKTAEDGLAVLLAEAEKA